MGKFDIDLETVYGWKNLYRHDVEEVFGIKFNDEELEIFGGFPSTLELIS